jgi:Ecdysteroid kinase-like family
MSVELPKFVTNLFLQKIFVKNFGENLVVKDFWGEWATNKGDNYASEMYRIHVDYELNGTSRNKPVLLKVC